MIIGKATGKILFIGVRNKYCTACTQGGSSRKAPELVFANGNRYYLRGFKQAEEVHGVRYTGDGDSSMFPTLVQCVTVWG